MSKRRPPKVNPGTEGQKEARRNYYDRARGDRSRRRYELNPPQLSEAQAAIQAFLRTRERHRRERRDPTLIPRSEGRRRRAAIRFYVALADLPKSPIPEYGAYREELVGEVRDRLHQPGLPESVVDDALRDLAERGEAHETEADCGGEAIKVWRITPLEGAVLSWIGPRTTEKCAEMFRCSANTWRNWAAGKSCPAGLQIKRAGRRGLWYYRNEAQ